MPTKIAWTNETWNFQAGCTKCGQGCRHCWAERLAAARLKNHPLYQGLTKNGKWTGEVRLCTEINRNDILEQPFHWKNQRRIFVCSMSDLFHPKVDIGFLTHIFDTIEQCSQHTFQILTKRPEQALKMMWGKHGEGWRYFGDGDYHFNVHLIVSISTQKEADEKIPILLQISAAVRGVSIEPMLEGIDISRLFDNYYLESPLGHITFIDWVIVGCESGPHRRPCKLEWVRSIVRQCKKAGVAVFVKQLEINGKVSHKTEEWPEDLRHQEYPKIVETI
jgi:protein gp37